VAALQSRPRLGSGCPRAYRAPGGTAPVRPRSGRTEFSPDPRTFFLGGGETLTPMLLARRFTLNPVLIILTLVFWFWMWGVIGAILAVPMLAILKIISDRLRPLKALGHFLEGK
jgi:hypothetical protein